MFAMSRPSTYPTLSLPEQETLIQKLEIFKVEGWDKQGHVLLCIVGKLFPAKLVGMEALKKYLDEKIYPQLRKQPYSVVYFHTGVQRSENFPGISFLRSICETIPMNVRENLKAIYFVHPGLQSRLFLGIFGSLLITKRLYEKVRYLYRLDFLWRVVKRKDMEIPEYIYNYDEELDYISAVEYALESEHPRVNCAAASSDYSAISTYSTRCIA